ncbi:hypothetical protein ZIOFF_066330 [Zingiber officinale]|uniref:Reverse transcriptase domain-containing protein n=1 Tax=Zingiber officinale TaxID=94328 RepID=A0A8J5KDR1_ZINOF|nr:hypothetical protein ZIOFF_066330 [Zingiber officinale]
MGSAATEIRLDLKLLATRTVGSFLKEAATTFDNGVAKLEESVRGLVDERKKIVVFKRELPICMFLLIEVDLSECEEEGADGMKLKADCKEKTHWMSSAQLWSSNSTSVAPSPSTALDELCPAMDPADPSDCLEGVTAFGVAMHPDSIEWTAFWVPDGLYEWLDMPFGLKNAPAVFQRKMDACFKGTEDFIAVYIDDIVVFSPDERSHEHYLERMLSICQKNGLILSPTKMKIAVPEIEFLGAIIENCRIKLQPHIITKIADFNDNELKTTKGMRSWLGLLNYARNYIPNLGKLLGPLYAKTSPNGERKLNQQDWDLIHQLKTKVRQLPDLEIPPPECYMILEVDGCMDGWSDILFFKAFAFLSFDNCSLFDLSTEVGEI